MVLDSANKSTWRRSIVIKIFLLSFVCIHLPLIALLIAFGTDTAADGLSAAIVVLAATLLGTVACLATMWWLTRPLRLLALAITRYRSGGSFSEERLNLHGNDEIAVVTRAVCGMVGEIAALAERVDGQPGLDPLTGLLNGSAAYGVELDRLGYPTNSGEAITVAVFELDAIDSLPLSHDREVADLALVAVGDLVRAHFAPRPVAARMSATTFVLLFAGDGPEAIYACCEALRRAISELDVGSDIRRRLRATFGLATRRERESMADLLHRADMALFRAKDTLRTGLEALKP
ncbi:GGDEF domain-containing protein [Rhizobium sp. AG855]|uniref:GGDEF domain-containing protein n=1 Tax=Rhizobium sp. AG855 TaxID=2183898 RepID=UPI000E749EF2|nr:GGDEF domain-containing protein [Rhizobium sp. AG855]RKE84444.1 diguanylate cyclase (GGDEF)-like protein [Rhizobium sp. AG855]